MVKMGSETKGETGLKIWTSVLTAAPALGD